MRDRARNLMFIAIVLAISGCHPNANRQQSATTRAVRHDQSVTSHDSTIAFSSPRDGFALRYPNQWTAQPSNDFVLELHRCGSSATISMDVPSLPPHLPGMIRLSLVENGFLDDLKKATTNLRTLEKTDVTVPDAQARRVVTSWSKDHTEFRQSAILMIHADRVYILRATAPADQFDATARELDDVLKSLTWTNRR